MGLIGLRLLVSRSFPRILDGEAGGDDEHLSETCGSARFDDHPAEAEVDGEISELASEFREAQSVALSPGGDRPQFDESSHTVPDRSGVGRIEERECLDVSEIPRGHLEDHSGEISPLYLRLCELGAAGEVVFSVETDAHTGSETPATACPLVGRCLRDGFDGQTLDLRAFAVARDSRRSSVDDRANARNGQRRLSNVGRHDDSPSGVRREDPVLFRSREPCVQGNNLGVWQTEALERVDGITDLPLTGTEDENVAVAFAIQLFDGVADALRLVPRLRTILVVERSVAGLDGIRTAGHFHDGSMGEVL